ncbi:hypothetical protein [Aquibacillus kalidii]|uniref:hypothetical protein n=1 Tax=Aquibacillus kalidii TaxID=2762597 RepID=UPI001648AE64|nr:hypothetical protein [Aquibacillus kalidii]
MIQFIGESELILPTDNYTFLLTKKHLKKTMTKFKILSHQLTADERIIKIKFVFEIQEKRHCRGMDDYMSYAYAEHREKLPSYASSAYVKVFDISSIGYRDKKLRQ